MKSITFIIGLTTLVAGLAVKPNCLMWHFAGRPSRVEFRLPVEIQPSYSTRSDVAHDVIEEDQARRHVPQPQIIIHRMQIADAVVFQLSQTRDRPTVQVHQIQCAVARQTVMKIPVLLGVADGIGALTLPTRVDDKSPILHGSFDRGSGQPLDTQFTQYI